MDNFGLSTFDFDEFDSPDDGEIERKKAEAEFLETLCKGFVADWKTWTLGNISNVFDILKGKLEDYEMQHGQFKLTSYVAMKVLPVVALAVCEELQRSLPASCRLGREHSDNFIMEFAQQMDPHRYADSYVSIVNYVDLLDYASEPKWSRVLDANAAGWLENAARKEIARMMQAPPPENDMEKEVQLRKFEHLGQSASGRFAFGFNTESEQQWEVRSLDFLLDPAGDIREEKIVTPRAYAYVMRKARDRLQTLQSTELQEWEMEEYQHLKTIVETGQLPWGYRQVDMAIRDEGDNGVDMDEDPRVDSS